MSTQAAAAHTDTPSTPKMRISDRPEYKSKPNPLTFGREATVADAVAAMSERNYGAVIVTDGDGKVEGVVTERDVMRKIVNAKRDAQATKLSDIMTTEVRTARADDDVLDWLRIMSNERFRRLPIVDDDGRLKAVFTQGDFVSYTWPELMSQATQLAKATVFRNWHIFLIVGAVMVYTVIMIAVL
ncbi:CBS domain-containing protein [Rhodovibrio sodomensis]|nr:CBS domain-containing protein [Rhodovibrio sodomensis]